MPNLCGAKLRLSLRMGGSSAPTKSRRAGELSVPTKKFNFAFWIGAEQMNRLRECGDLRRNMVNLRTSVLAPITLPTWDHIAQLSKNAYRANTKWSFLKADRDSSYKQFPLDPDYAGITAVTLRGPATSKWRAFSPEFSYSDPPHQ